MAHHPTETVDVDELFSKIAQWPEVEAIALGGSRASGNSDAKSDYDVYLYTTAPIDENRRYRRASGRMNGECTAVSISAP
ncbi:nucleotidyltransferase domain-containing protein [Bifidobacterium choloepi]|uniref:nucleotidyltransferase domain-containing protein n=1 Tax=Bifidobacterium choloepi TaxID=2614131 RepID=UPI001E37D82C|nr:nucleotidyltransferase domain-containing protein [Bifidobacterium choloepi]